jgi:hypothetical protein
MIGLARGRLFALAAAAASAEATVFVTEAGRGQGGREAAGGRLQWVPGPGGAAISRIFAQASQQSCTVHLLSRCARLLERASVAAAAFPRAL